MKSKPKTASAGTSKVYVRDIHRDADYKNSFQDERPKCETGKEKP